MAEKSLNKVINRKFIIFYLILSIVIFFLIIFTVNRFVNAIIYQHIYRVTIDSIYSVLEHSIDVNSYGRLISSLKSIENDYGFMTDISIYNYMYDPISDVATELSNIDKEIFKQVYRKGEPIKKRLSQFSFTYYTKWQPPGNGVYYLTKPFFVKIKFDFFDILYKLGLHLFIGIGIILFLGIIALFWFNRRLSRAITNPFVDLAVSMSQLGTKDLTMLDEKLERTDIKEVNMLLASYQEMTSELTASFEELRAVNEELEDLYDESNSLTVKLNDVIGISTRLTDAVFDNKENLMLEVFHVAKKLIPEADYGSVYHVANNQMVYIDAFGHDLKKLNKIPQYDLNLEDFKDIYYIDYVGKDKYNDKFAELKQVSLDAKEPIKSTLLVRLRVGKELAGAISFDIAKGSDKRFTAHSIETMKALGNLASAFLAMHTYRDIHERFQREIILAIIKILEIHDNYTRGHSENVAKLSRLIAEEMNLSEEEIKQTEWAGLVHDIGKILVSKGVLNKPGMLNNDEFDQIKKHPLWGFEVLFGSEELKDIARFVRYHHERWDGTGYPDGLNGDDIPLISRIIALADAWDTMMSNRVYKDKLTITNAIQELKDNRGKQFAPEVVDVALRLLEKRKMVQ